VLLSHRLQERALATVLRFEAFDLLGRRLQAVGQFRHPLAQVRDLLVEVLREVAELLDLLRGSCESHG
jgi:hypothetical protein